MSSSTDHNIYKQYIAKFCRSIKPIKPFVLGCVTGMFTSACVQPLDIIKTRI